MKSSDLFVKALEAEGVEYIFGIPGEENLDVLDSLSRSDVTLVLTRHEQAAGFMAATYGRLTGRTGVCLSTLGPGATNFVTAAAYAQLGGMPMLMVTGQKPIKTSKQGQFQIVNVVDMMRPLTKYTKQLVSGTSIPSSVREAFRLAEERSDPGPSIWSCPRISRVRRSTCRCLGAQLAISVNNCPPPRDPRSRMTSFKRTQRKYVQKAYRVRNWREYETGLRARGSLTVWLGLTDGKLANWNSPRPTRRKPGRQRKYSNHAIETTVTLGLVFGLASRQTEGFLRSLLTLLNLDNDVPDHSTISRRKARLGKVASYERRTVKPVHLLIDSSGLSVHVGQLRTPPKARDYRKLHLAVDEQTSDVVACELTSKRARDASRVASLVGQIERPIASAKADAAYDTGDVYKTLENHRAHRSPKVLIPPRKGAQLALDSAGTRQRNRNIRARSRVGKRKWYVASGYSRRSKVETTFHRYKAILGSAMRARGLASQRVEVRLGCKILNTMTALGIPDGEMIG